VHLGGADLSSMTISQARELTSLRAADFAARKLVLRYVGESLPVSLCDLGAAVDVEASVEAAHRIGRHGNILHRIAEALSARRHPIELPVAYDFDKESAAECLRQTAGKINRQPIDAKPIVVDDAFRIEPEKPGIRLNEEKSLIQITRAVNSGAREAQLVIETAEPKLKASDFEGIDGLIGSYSTTYKRIACQSLNGTLLKPGEEFSYNKVVGPRDQKYGFRNAKMFVEGRIESGTGGGVCQISTTVYNAALLADLQIVTRSHHSRPVVYAPVGRDATVAPNIDLKFRNNTDSPVYISASVGERTVDVAIYGHKQEGREVEIVTQGHSVIGPRTVTQVDAGLAPGGRVMKQGGRSGHRVTVYRIVKDSGQVVSKELVSRDYYAPESRIVAVPKPAEM
jgi:vancomycin resistance protein YoaR